MTREEMITHEAIVSAIADTGKGRSRDGYYINALADHENGFKEGFVEGAQWADAHPRWHDMSEEPQKYDDFLVITKGGCMDFAHFNQDGWHKSHYDGSSDFLYWMTPPAMPKGGEE
jgi:hypothetical protein